VRITCLQNSAIHNLVVLRIFGTLIWENLSHFDVIFDAIYNLYIIVKCGDSWVTSHANMFLVNSFIHHFNFNLHLSVFFLVCVNSFHFRFNFVSSS
jgi:hypothetical protein